MANHLIPNSSALQALSEQAMVDAEVTKTRLAVLRIRLDNLAAELRSAPRSHLSGELGSDPSAASN